MKENRGLYGGVAITDLTQPQEIHQKWVLKVEDSCKFHMTVSMFSDTVAVVFQWWYDHILGKQYYCSINSKSSKSWFVVPPNGLDQLIRSSTMTFSQARSHKNMDPYTLVSIQTPPPTKPEASQNPNSVGRRWTTYTKKVGWFKMFRHNCLQCKKSWKKPLDK